jgi:hypothetical protein
VAQCERPSHLTLRPHSRLRPAMGAIQKMPAPGNERSVSQVGKSQGKCPKGTASKEVGCITRLDPGIPGSHDRPKLGHNRTLGTNFPLGDTYVIENNETSRDGTDTGRGPRFGATLAVCDDRLWC